MAVKSQEERDRLSREERWIEYRGRIDWIEGNTLVEERNELWVNRRKKESERGGRMNQLKVRFVGRDKGKYTYGLNKKR